MKKSKKSASSSSSSSSSKKKIAAKNNTSASNTETQTKTDIKDSKEAKSELPTYVEQSKDGSVRLSVNVKPGAKKSEVVSLSPDLEVRLAAQPREGEANKELQEFMAQCLNLNKSSVELLRGQKSRAKLLLIKGLQAKDILVKLLKMLPKI
eukprot:TRINITY_DN1075_c0_g1_i1.p1 TRINITY_DN1075_c0_g1~~TRINITY_DN1075_c0_g1_i1.p1  ORF type:complete len:151 (+),score=46.28 TRINITY_DN1075_c0_g1_i1:65-517(+)